MMILNPETQTPARSNINFQKNDGASPTIYPSNNILPSPNIIPIRKGANCTNYPYINRNRYYPGISTNGICKASVENQDQFFQSVVKLMCTSREPDPIKPWCQLEDEQSSATGFITCVETSRGNICMLVTNAHAISNCVTDEEGREIIFARCHNKSDQIKCIVAYVYHECDVAFLFFEKIPSDICQIEIPNPKEHVPRLMTRIVAIGFPNNVRTPSVSFGIISRTGMILEVHSHKPGEAIQFDAAINPGNSGGTIMNVTGENKIGGVLIGMVFQGMPNSQGMGFGIPSQTLQQCLQRFKVMLNNGKNWDENGRFHSCVDVYRELGVRYQPVLNEFMHNYYNMGENEGVLVIDVPEFARGKVVNAKRFAVTSGNTGVFTDVSFNNPNENEAINMNCGLKREDIILQVDGQNIGSDGTYIEDGRRVHFEKMYMFHGLERFMNMIVLRRTSSGLYLLSIKQELIEKTDLVPKITYGTKISQLVFGGIVFSELSLPLILKSMAANGPSTSQIENLKYGHKKSPYHRVVVVNMVLSSVGLNDSYEGLHQKEVTKVNGQSIMNLFEFHRIAEKSSRTANPPGNGYVKIEFKTLETVIIDYDVAKQHEQAIFKQHHIPQPGYYFDEISRYSCQNCISPKIYMKCVAHQPDDRTSKISCIGCRAPLSIAELVRGALLLRPSIVPLKNIQSNDKNFNLQGENNAVLEKCDKNTNDKSTCSINAMENEASHIDKNSSSDKNYSKCFNVAGDNESNLPILREPARVVYGNVNL